MEKTRRYLKNMRKRSNSILEHKKWSFEKNEFDQDGLQLLLTLQMKE